MSKDQVHYTVISNGVTAFKPGQSYRDGRIDAFPHYEVIPANAVIEVNARDITDRLDHIGFTWDNKHYTLNREYFVQSCITR